MYFALSWDCVCTTYDAIANPQVLDFSPHHQKV